MESSVKNNCRQFSEGELARYLNKGGQIMTRWMRKSIAIWATAFMVLSTMVVLTTALADEGPAMGRVNQPAPQWKVNDYFRYEFKARSTTRTIPVSWGGTLPGTAAFTGKIDQYEQYTVTSTANADFYQVAYNFESWENGTYILTPQNMQPSSPANYNYYTKVISTGPTKIRKTDLATGDSTTETTSNEQYTATPQYGGFTNFAATETTLTTAVPGGYFSLYKFPLDFAPAPSATWQISSGSSTINITFSLNTFLSLPFDSIVIVL